MSFRDMRILALSPVGGYGGFNTSVHRVHSLKELGCQVELIDSSGALSPWKALAFRACNKGFRWGLPVALPDLAGHGARLLNMAGRGPWDIIWLERALTIGPETLVSLRRRCPRALIVGFALDDMNARHNQSFQFLKALKHYDWFLTNKSYNVAELRGLGCPRTLFVGNGYDPATFRPLRLRPSDEARFGGDVGFIGSFEEDRARALVHLAELGFEVRVWGSGWPKNLSKHARLRLEGRPLHGDDFAHACQAFKINLGFLRKMNRDLQTTRSVEIPACGGFMLAERTVEHQEMFREGSEAEFFGSWQELAAKCADYLSDAERRLRVARAGLERCQRSGYSNKERMRTALTAVLGRSSFERKDAAPES
jgi:spore maturation protein CgeB